jgi:hypothetical protein
MTNLKRITARQLPDSAGSELHEFASRKVDELRDALAALESR